MPTFDKSPNREQRALACNRAGTLTMSDFSGSISASETRPAKGILAFESSCGHLEIRNAASCGADRYYDAGGVFDRLHRGRSALPFQRMIGRKTRLTFPNDCAKMQCGGSSEVSQAKDYFQFARALSRGSDYCDFDKQVTREKREIVGYFAAGKLSTMDAPPLFVSHNVVEAKVHGAPAWRPSSASSTRREGSSNVVSRPSSAQSLRASVSLQRHAESSLRSDNASSFRSTTVATLDQDPMSSFIASKRSLSRNLTFSKAPRKTL